MARIQILIVVIILSALIGGIVAAKANTTQSIYVTRFNPNICDFRTNYTLQDQGQGIYGVTKATDVPGPCDFTLVYSPYKICK